jgi:putative oxygen-independent coproporphyrinogen III oxidase
VAAGAALWCEGVPAPLERSAPLGVYLHVPYCATRCSYCDFNTYTSGDRSTWADTAIAELRLAARALGARARPASTVFFGGGTPTLLPAGDLGRVLRAIEAELGLVPGAEVTVEANPESVDPRSLAELLALGATRLSLGMQSGAPHVLRLLNRTHAPDRPPEAAREARQAGFEHVSLDLIYGSPNETHDDWRRSLEAALEAGPDHVSAYGLEIAPGTRLHAQVRRGLLAAPDEDALAERYLLAEELLDGAGLHWYEVSNWARDAASRCLHNVGYWNGGEWWGIGPGAHSGVGGRRWWNVRHPAAWAAKVAAGELPEDAGEDLDAEQRRLERLMVEVRTREGIAAGGGTARLAEDGLLDVGGGQAVLTLRGRLLADLVTRRLAG